MASELVTGTVTGTLNRYNPNNGYNATTSSSLNTALTLYSDKVSVDTGRFIPGIYRINPYLVSKESCSRGGDSLTDKAIYPDTPVQYTAKLSGDSRVYFAMRAKALIDGTPSFGNMAERAVQQAAAKLGESKAGLGETLGELRETLNLLRHPFKDLRDFLYKDNLKNLGLYNRISQYAKSGIWGERGGTALRGSDAAKAAANSWLELRYGLMPLVYTVQDLVKLANAKALEFDRDVIRTARSSVKLKEHVSLLSPTFGAQLAQTEFFCTAHGSEDKTVRACIQYKLDSPRSMRELLGLAPQYLPELAWELTRLSFVVDWWFSVGSWLGAFRGLFLEPTIHVLGNTVGMKVIRTVTVNATSAVASVPNAPQTNRGEVGYYTLTSYQRAVNQHIPILPQFKPEIKSIPHTIDALALILQPILGHMRR